MEMVIDFPGGARVDAHFGSFTVQTDQPPQGGGENSAPTPFATFLASIGTCAGIYVLGFCRQRNIPTEGIRLIQNLEVDRASGMVSKVLLDIQLPPNFPEKYKTAVIRAAEQCTVKKHFEHPPQFQVSANIAASVPA
jgi:putative redox protein